IPFISPKQAHLREFLRFVATNKDILERIHSMALFPVEMIQVLYFIYHEKASFWRLFKAISERFDSYLMVFQTSLKIIC
ncbi:MAG TPA: hypothetical protein VJH22_07585, partial [Candidatus Nanoarchaeia archaeon]|nr:hypothetical protein [Candidatus Nanoarchaeia archaeon]